MNSKFRELVVANFIQKLAAQNGGHPVIYHPTAIFPILLGLSAHLIAVHGFDMSMSTGALIGSIIATSTFAFARHVANIVNHLQLSLLKTLAADIR